MDTQDIKNIALVAHDFNKKELIEWAVYNKVALSNHSLYAIGETADVLERELGTPVNKLDEGLVGDENHLGNKISEGGIDMLFFFMDPFEQLSYDPSAKALLRIATAWNLPMACNRATADFLVTSPLLHSSYLRQQSVADTNDRKNLSVALLSEADQELGLVLTI